MRRHYYCHVDSSHYVNLDFSHDAYHEVMVLGRDPLALCLHVERSFPALLANLTACLGRQPPLPDWVHDGAILGVQGGTEKVK